MKVIIAGGRRYRLTPDDIDKIGNIDITEVVSGGARGADKCGELYAHELGLPLKIFNANWKLSNKMAGPIRNRKMAEYADAVALFPGGKGTQSMYNEAVKAGIKIYDFRNKG